MMKRRDPDKLARYRIHSRRAMPVESVLAGLAWMAYAVAGRHWIPLTAAIVLSLTALGDALNFLWIGKLLKRPTKGDPDTPT